MDGEAERLERLLAGQLDQRDEDELETELADRPSLRRQLADMALDAERAQAAPAIRILPSSSDDEASSSDVDVGPLLGSGGMALVRLGRQLKLDRSVAVRILRDSCRSEQDVARLLRERSHVEVEDTTWEHCEAGANVLLHCVLKSAAEG